MGKIRQQANDLADFIGLTRLLGKKTRDEEEEELRSMREKAARGTATGALQRTRKLEEKEAGKAAAAKDLEERNRLQEQLKEIQDKAYVDSLSKEEQINEIHKRRNDLARMISENQSKMTEANRLKAQIELEKQTAEEAAKRREVKPVGLVAKEAVHVDPLSSMGMISSVGAVMNPMVDVGRRQLARLDDIYNKMGNGGDIHAP